MDNPVPQSSGRHADLQGFLRGQSSTGVEQIVDIPGGGLHRPGQSSSSSDGLGEGGFSHFFTVLKKVAKLASHSGSELLPELSPSTRAAQLEDSVEWVRLRDDNSLARLTSGTDVLELYSLASHQPGVEVVWIRRKGMRRGAGLVLAQGHACLYV